MGIAAFIVIFIGLITGIVFGYKISKKYLSNRFLQKGSQKELYGRNVYKFGLLGWFISIIPAVFLSFLFGGTYFGGLFENLGNRLGDGGLFILLGIYFGIFFVIVVVGFIFTYFFSLLADILIGLNSKNT